MIYLRKDNVSLIKTDKVLEHRNFKTDKELKDPIEFIKSNPKNIGANYNLAYLKEIIDILYKQDKKMNVRISFYTEHPLIIEDRKGSIVGILAPRTEDD